MGLCLGGGGGDGRVVGRLFPRRPARVGRRGRRPCEPAAICPSPLGGARDARARSELSPPSPAAAGASPSGRARRHYVAQPLPTPAFVQAQAAAMRATTSCRARATRRRWRSSRRGRSGRGVCARCGGRKAAARRISRTSGARERRERRCARASSTARWLRSLRRRLVLDRRRRSGRGRVGVLSSLKFRQSERRLAAADGDRGAAGGGRRSVPDLHSRLTACAGRRLAGAGRGACSRG